MSCKENTTATTAVSEAVSVEKPAMDIHTAVISDNLEAVKQHIKAGTDLNAKDAMSGSSALITAATFNKVEIAKALIT